jgi:hypothetical protein
MNLNFDKLSTIITIDHSDFNGLAKSIHANNVKVGWWEGSQACIFQKIQMASTEIAEATEGARKNLMDDKLPHRKMEEVELADVFIRVLDVGGRMDLRYVVSWIETEWCDSSKSVGMQHLGINKALIQFAVQVYRDSPAPVLSKYYSTIINCILIVASNRNYDIMAAVHEKMGFNATRADHKLENRAKDNGKSF